MPVAPWNSTWKVTIVAVAVHAPTAQSAGQLVQVSPGCKKPLPQVLAIAVLVGVLVGV